MTVSPPSWPEDAEEWIHQTGPNPKRQVTSGVLPPLDPTSWESFWVGRAGGWPWFAQECLPKPSFDNANHLGCMVSRDRLQYTHLVAGVGKQSQATKEMSTGIHKRGMGIFSNAAMACYAATTKGFNDYMVHTHQLCILLTGMPTFLIEGSWGSVPAQDYHLHQLQKTLVYDQSITTLGWT